MTKSPRRLEAETFPPESLTTYRFKILRQLRGSTSELRSMPLAAYRQGMAALLEPQSVFSKLRLPALVLSASRSRFTDPILARNLL